MRIDVVTTCGRSPGWAPVAHLARLAARVFQGDLIELDTPSRWRGIADLRRRPRSGTGGLLAILRYAHEMRLLRHAPVFRRPYRFVAVWIIDSPLTETMPSWRSFADIDLVGVMRSNDLEAFARVAGDRVMRLGWGADVLALGSGAGDRRIDIQRLGRQPPDWDDDIRSAAAASARGLVFRGRPAFFPEPEANQRAIMAACAESKFVIAHSNLASPAAYTHPTQEYITACWTDALASGATVAGRQPHGDRGMQELLWPGATLDFDRIDLEHNLDALAEAAGDWTPERARENHRQALLRLDWRWRLKSIADQARMEFTGLDADLDQIVAAAQGLS